MEMEKKKEEEESEKREEAKIELQRRKAKTCCWVISDPSFVLSSLQHHLLASGSFLVTLNVI